MSPTQPALSAAERSAEREPTPEDFGELFERHSQAIYNFCFRRTGIGRSPRT